MDSCTIASPRLSAAIAAGGAELVSLRDASDREVLWQAGPAWPRHAPVLFPIVGRLNGDALRHDGATYRMAQHGFARDRRFEWLAHGPDSCRLLLTDDADTQARYPFPFRLEIAYAVAGDRLDFTYTIANPGDRPLPVSLGAHPGFRWPLVDGLDKSAHSLTFSHEEPGPARRVAGGLIAAETDPSPVHGRTLPLSESLFAADAIILDPIRSTSVTYTAPGAPTVEVGWSGFPQLGIWSRAGGDFLCIEPWHGHADPVGYAGPFAEKPGLMHIAPGDTQTLSLYVRVF